MMVMMMMMTMTMMMMLQIVEVRGRGGDITALLLEMYNQPGKRIIVSLHLVACSFDPRS